VLQPDGRLADQLESCQVTTFRALAHVERRAGGDRQLAADLVAEASA